ncbi:hypothetical protein [Corynebacterium pilosum]|uniref:Uncharacterized protein n=1 Tax=Corynebacterium pilosum TaxID=35756 RepID=A0A376CNF1_9CORY|nr:hypothetical protein [Corynebacterium pilosum]STC69629.1 Uncharacterised protein [Corynebacterium pilosum]
MKTSSSRVLTLVLVIVLAVVAIAAVWWWTNREGPTPEQRAAAEVAATEEAAEHDLADVNVTLDTEVKTNAWRGVTSRANVAPDDAEAITAAADFLVSRWSDDPKDPSYFTGWIISENPPTSYQVDPRADNEWIVGLLADPIEGVSDVSVVINNADTGEGNRSDRIDLTPMVNWAELAKSDQRIEEIVETFVPYYDAQPFINLQDEEGTGPKLSLQRATPDMVSPALALMAALEAEDDFEQVSLVAVRDNGGQREVEIKFRNDTPSIPRERVQELIDDYLPEATLVG